MIVGGRKNLFVSEGGEREGLEQSGICKLLFLLYFNSGILMYSDNI